jgi:hypothetical protein
VSTCTCCAQHHRGAHRTGELVAPLAHLDPPTPPALERASAALEKATQRESKAHEAWGAAESARRRLEAELMATWGNHPGGIKAAPPARLDELTRLGDRAKELFGAYKRAGQETVDARQRVAVEGHKATQLMIANW